MKEFVGLLAFGSALGAMASPAAAKTPAQRYADCLVQTRAGQVEALLAARTAEAASRPYRELADNDRCFAQVFGNAQFTPGDVDASMDVLRGRLAERELLARSGEVAALRPLPLQQKRYIRPWFAATGRHPAVDEMAACMADTDPAGIDTLIRTVPRSEDENSAIAALSQSLTKCLSAGTRIDASRGALRAALADALYQRLSDPALSVATSSTERSQ